MRRQIRNKPAGKDAVRPSAGGRNGRHARLTGTRCARDRMEQGRQIARRKRRRKWRERERDEPDGQYSFQHRCAGRSKMDATGGDARRVDLGVLTLPSNRAVPTKTSACRPLTDKDVGEGPDAPGPNRAAFLPRLLQNFAYVRRGRTQPVWRSSCSTLRYTDLMKRQLLTWVLLALLATPLAMSAAASDFGRIGRGWVVVRIPVLPIAPAHAVDDVATVPAFDATSKRVVASWTSVARQASDVIIVVAAHAAAATTAARLVQQGTAENSPADLNIAPCGSDRNLTAILTDSMEARWLSQDL